MRDNNPMKKRDERPSAETEPWEAAGVEMPADIAADAAADTVSEAVLEAAETSEAGSAAEAVAAAGLPEAAVAEDEPADVPVVPAGYVSEAEAERREAEAYRRGLEHRLCSVWEGTEIDLRAGEPEEGSPSPLDIRPSVWQRTEL